MSALPPGEDDRYLGRVVDGRYRIVRRLGEGGMGIVFEAEHLKLGKRVALKIVAPERLGDPEVAARFTREARATAQIEHPHVASGFDYGLLPEGGAFLVAQLVRGSSLREWIERGAAPWADACRVAAQIADALDAIHRAGYVHRDLTPENVLVTSRDDGRSHVYVLDFGVAALTAASAGEGGAAMPLTEAGTVVGTNGYMAPEQSLGRPLDARADLYALGVLLWEMIAGRALFAQHGSATEIVSAQLSGATELFPPGAAGGGLPFDLERLLRDLLAADPARRPSSALEVRRALIAIAEGKGAGTGTGTGTGAGTGTGTGTGTETGTGTGTGTGALAARGTVDVARWSETLRSWQALAAIGIGSAAGLAVAVGIALAAGGGGGDALEIVAPAVAPSPPPSAVAMPPPRAVDPLIAEAIAEMGSASHRTREQAASQVLAADPAQVPPFAVALAALLIANTCDERALHLETVRSVGDPRAIPALERLRDAPRRGCGRRGRSDCYACIRGALDRTLEELRREPR